MIIFTAYEYAIVYISISKNLQSEIDKIEFAKKADNPDREKLLDLRLKIMKEIDPFNSNGAALQLHHLEHNRNVMENISQKIEE